MLFHSKQYNPIIYYRKGTAKSNIYYGKCKSFPQAHKKSPHSSTNAGFFDKVIPRLTLVFDPTHAVWKVALRRCALTHFSRGLAPDGLTSRPHHAPCRFGQITWTVLPATGIGLQPQTRGMMASLYRQKAGNARTPRKSAFLGVLAIG